MPATDEVIGERQDIGAGQCRSTQAPGDRDVDSRRRRADRCRNTFLENKRAVAAAEAKDVDVLDQRSQTLVGVIRSTENNWANRIHIVDRGQTGDGAGDRTACRTRRASATLEARDDAKARSIGVV